MDELPDKIIQLTALRRNNNLSKRCACLHPRYEIDENCREVICAQCGAKVDAFDALAHLARDSEWWQREVESLLEQRKEIANWKPHLPALKNMERENRQGMIPVCPHCGKGIKVEEITGYTNRARYEQEKIGK